MTAQRAIQLIILLVTAASLLLTYKYFRKHPENWAYLIAPLSWLIHLLFFYALFFLEVGGVDLGISFTFWSSILRLQASFLILGVLAMLVYDWIFFRTRLAS